MEEKINTSWDTFRRTGNIEAYLLYKSVTDIEDKEDKEGTWQKSEQEVLS